MKFQYSHPLPDFLSNIQYTPIIKVVNGNLCNFKCSYCYELENQNDELKLPKLMSEEVLVKIVKEFLHQPQSSIRFIWHGGEPLLRGLKFFENAIIYQDKFNKNGQIIFNSIQTNGSLIDYQWIQFFRKNRFSVGISIDGPDHIHNQFRKYKNGGGTYSEVIKAIKTLQQSNVEVGVICTLTNQSPCADDLLYFFLDNGIHKIHFKPYEGEKKEFTISSNYYGEFLIRMFELLVSIDDPLNDIIEITSLVLPILGGYPTLCTQNGHCSSYLTVDVNGNIGPCDLIHHKYKTFGNILLDSLVNILNSKEYLEFVEFITKVPDKCYICEIFRKECFGGCTFGRLFNDMNTYCNARCDLVLYIEKYLLEHNMFT